MNFSLWDSVLYGLARKEKNLTLLLNCSCLDAKTEDGRICSVTGWSPLIETLGMKHRPHDTRHTCISMLAVAGVSDKVIKKIVGHKGQGVTEVVYTHFEIEELIDAINKI